MRGRHRLLCLPALLEPECRVHGQLNDGKEERMTTVDGETWKSSRFSIERVAGKADRAVFRFFGPFTARDVYHSLSPDAFGEIFEAAPGGEKPVAYVFDLTEVPYMDSLGLGMLVRQYVRCKNKGIDLSITGMSARVMELFRFAKMDSALPIAAMQKLD